ncbi:MAG TPA: serine/threonine-protein kinase [Ktedonobacteraceae bacterium]|nr:serine/threonine-protein kinase [Ktedonobacteraceae bacterium]
MNRVGQQLGNYLVLSQVGRGGFAEVYLGEHRYLKTKAAIKVLHTHLAQEEQAGFFAEAQTIAHLQHPHIVRVLEFGVQDGLPYLVMEYAPHGTLRQRYPKGVALPLTTILPIVQQVAAALQYAHDQNLIHRDVKPENMLVGENNEVLLSDFGVALIVQGMHSQEHQEIVGTVGYMAPEQLLGKPQFASDQYALGVIVYEWLTGERPFQGSFAEVSSQHIFTPPPPLHEKVPDTPSAVEEVVLKALAKDPAQRFPTIQAFADALETAAPVPVTGDALHASASPRRSASVRLRVLLVTLLLLLATGSLGSFLLAPRFFPPAAPPGPEQLLYLQATGGMPAIADPLQAQSSLLWTNTCTFTGGALHVSTSAGVGICNPLTVSVDDFAYQVEVTIIKGNMAALEFRSTPSLTKSPGYFFFILSSGQCGLILKSRNTLAGTESDRSLFNRAHCAAIRTGAKQANLLTVIARGSDMYLYINKQYVAHVVDHSAASGFIGVFGGIAGAQGAVDVAFRDLQVWNL